MQGLNLLIFRLFGELGLEPTYILLSALRKESVWNQVLFWDIESYTLCSKNWESVSSELLCLAVKSLMGYENPNHGI